MLQMSGPQKKRPGTRESLVIGSFAHLELDTYMLMRLYVVILYRVHCTVRYMAPTERDLLRWVCPVARTVHSKLRQDEQSRTGNGDNPRIKLKILQGQLFLDLKESRLVDLLYCTWHKAESQAGTRRGIQGIPGSQFLRKYFT